MKTKFSLILLLIISLLLSGCAGKTEVKPSPSVEPQSTSENEVYPAPKDTSLGYPAPQSNPSAESTPIGTPEKSQLIFSATPDPKKDFVVISNVTHNESGLETITITNVSDQAQDINGYSILIPSTNEHVNIMDVTLDPGKSYIIYNGPGAQEQTDGKAWLDTPALQKYGDEIILLNRPGRVIWTYIYYP